MGKANRLKRNSAGTQSSSSSSPYSKPSTPSSQKPSTSSSSVAASSNKNNVFKFNTTFGQHILKNPGVADAIVAKANLKPSDTVLEVGPGTGNLTVRILERARRVVAVELDPRMAAEVTKRVQGREEARRLEVVVGDVCRVDLANLGSVGGAGVGAARNTVGGAIDVCISNTPYQISSPLVFKLLAMPNPPRVSILMFQREFALRLTARPGDALYCRLSVNAQLFARITHVMKVGRNNFRPPPQVESSVVRIEPKLGKERPRVAWAEWDGMVRICFVRRNRTMRASWLGTREVLALVERNWRVWCGMRGVKVDEGLVGETEEEQEGARQREVDEMDVDGGEDDRMDADEDDGVGDDWQGFGEGVDDDDGDVPAFFREEAKAAGKGNGAAVPKTKSKRKKTKVAELVREKIRKVLEDDTELADKRVGKCDETDFLRLLDAFNQEGIHFA